MADISKIEVNGTTYDIKDKSSGFVTDVKNRTGTSLVSEGVAKDTSPVSGFLDNWNSNTGLPSSQFSTLPYSYKNGDFYRLTNINSDVYTFDGNLAGHTVEDFGGDDMCLIKISDATPGIEAFIGGTLTLDGDKIGDYVSEYTTYPITSDIISDLREWYGAYIITPEGISVQGLVWYFPEDYILEFDKQYLVTKGIYFTGIYDIYPTSIMSWTSEVRLAYKETNITWNGVIGDKEILTQQSSYFVKVSDIILPYDKSKLVGKKYIINNNGTETTATISENDLLLDSYGVLCINLSGESKIICVKETHTNDDITFIKGTYFYSDVNTGTATNYVKSLSINGLINYIPSGTSYTGAASTEYTYDALREGDIYTYIDSRWDRVTDDYDSTEKQKVADAYADKHTHSNKSIIDEIASTDITNWNSKSTVSVSSTGTATDTVGYITVDGVEKKLAGGSGGTSDFNELTNRPKYNDATMTSSTNIPEVKTATWDNKSTVSVASTGTATDTVEYITIDGVEKKLAGSGGGTWGSITGTLSNQTDLQDALDAKQDSLIAGSHISLSNTTFNEVDYLTTTNQDIKLPYTFRASQDFEVEIKAAFNNVSVTKPILVGAKTGGFWLGCLSNQFVVRTYSQANHIVTSLPTVGQMMTIKVTYVSGVASLYFDDVLQGTANVTFVDTDNTYLFSDGSNLGVFNFNSFKLTSQGNLIYDYFSVKQDNVSTYFVYDSITNATVKQRVGSDFTTGGSIKTGGRTIVKNTIAATGVANTISDLNDDTSSYPVDKADTLTGLTATVTELNYVDGVTSNVQTQLNAKVNKTDIVNNVTSTDTDKPLSANMGKELQDEIDNLKAVGRYLSNWNCTTGLPSTNPSTSPYTYKTGDYYYVSTVGSTNYKPDGSSYTIGTASTTVETDIVYVGDYYIYDGSVWKLLQNTQRTVTFANIAGQPSDNSNLATALDAKVNANSAITGATKTKITYDSKGLVTSGEDLTASDIPDLTLSKISDVTASASDLNILDGTTATNTEVNCLSGVTSNIQTQINNKQNTLTQGTNITISNDTIATSASKVIIRRWS